MSLQICNVFLLLPAMAINVGLSPTPSGHMHRTYLASYLHQACAAPSFSACCGRAYVGGKCLSHIERIMEGIIS